MRGTVLSGTGGVWRVQLESGATVEASMRGRLKRGEERDFAPRDGERPLKLAVGDAVELTAQPDADGAEVCTISAILPRRSQLARRAPGRAFGERVVVANLDQVLIVFAAANPEPHPRMLDRFLVIAEANGLAARVIVNKCDLTAEAEARGRVADYERAG